MKVYLLWHDSGDYDSGPYLRGIYARREDAERDLPVEAINVTPSRYNGIDGPSCMTSDHTYCCSVEEYEVIQQPIGVVRLPDRPPSANTGGFMFSAALADSLQDLATREMIWSRVTRHEGPIGQIIERKESEDGLQVTIRLNE